MATDPNKKFGSPYDPGYRGTGKIEKPQERHSLRGCGDPNCSQCNPELANRPGGAPSVGGTRTGRFSSGGPYGGSNSAREAQIMAAVQAMSRSFGRGFGADMARAAIMESRARDGMYFDAESNEIKAMKPSSYTSARAAVEQYISAAPEQGFDDIVGNEEALEGLKDAIRAPVENKELYEAYGMKMPKGALLSGPPGCGKTMFARAAASEMRKLYGKAMEFISISGSELQSMYVGETEGRIKAIFTYAREYKKFHGHPLLVFMDEAEVLLPDRTGRVRRVAPWEESQVATFLAEMDGMQESGAFVLLATNRPEVIDQAVLRDGRCDFKIVVKRPNQDALEMILRKNFGKSPKLKDGLDDLVFAAMESFCDPHKVITEAHLITFSKGKFADGGGKNFTLEYVVSGAMAASVPGRATRYAFQRDKAAGSVSGLTVSDVLRAVNDLFEENKGLEHGFALDEFKNEFEAELRAAGKIG